MFSKEEKEKTKYLERLAKLMPWTKVSEIKAVGNRIFRAKTAVSEQEKHS